ncbi:YidH family protein [Corynebacterium nasicanis]|uniref:YidH family protein n=1 Tax=Corynebacterium nasicanis TaxID=1448267 RepID=A0ABW1QAG2_9CORY
MTTTDRSRLDQRLFPDGEEPDPQFTLSNERTYLAWTRTSLAFLAGGIALGAFPIEAVSTEWRAALSAFVIVIGMSIALVSALRWIRIQRAMRHSRPLPSASPLLLVTGAVVAASAVALWLFIL